MIKEYKIMKDTEMLNKEGLFFFVVVVLFSKKDVMKLQIQKKQLFFFINYFFPQHMTKIGKVSPEEAGEANSINELEIKLGKLMQEKSIKGC